MQREARQQKDKKYKIKTVTLGKKMAGMTVVSASRGGEEPFICREKYKNLMVTRCRRK
jgi:hypothetical protein